MECENENPEEESRTSAMRKYHTEVQTDKRYSMRGVGANTTLGQSRKSTEPQQTKTSWTDAATPDPFLTPLTTSFPVNFCGF